MVAGGRIVGSLAFVTLTGKAAIHDDASEVCGQWKRAYDRYFPTETDRAKAIFVETDVSRQMQPEGQALRGATMASTSAT